MQIIDLKYETIVMFFAIVAGTFFIAFILKKYLEKRILAKAKKLKIDTTGFVFINHLIVSIVYFLGFGWALLTLPITHTFAHTLLAGAGASTIILGFASQQLFTNILSGVYLVLVRPFKINDTIEFQGVQGTITEIDLTSIKIIDENQDTTILPTSLIISDKIKIIHKN